MNEATARAKHLALMQAPADVQAMALLTAFSDSGPILGKAANIFLGITRAASQHDQNLVLLPELETLLRLDQALPVALRIPGLPGLDALGPGAEGCVGTGSPGPHVRRTLEAMTPWLQSNEPFASAAKRADDRCNWGSAAPQITIRCCKPDLPANGALWRGRLRKRTDLIKPLDGMATEETIEITAEGHDGSQGQGWRRYSHFLVDCCAGPGLLHLVEDSGQIELNGNAHGSTLRIRKRVTVLLPTATNEAFGAAIALGFSTLLWQWALGFLTVGAPGPLPCQHNPPSVQPMPTEAKHIPPPASASDAVRVAVLGAGPAGLACAWLLSNPKWGDNKDKPAWVATNNPALKLKITLVDTACRPGGKAASGRRQGAEKGGIEEHGLHLLMGCYSNLLEMLKTLGATGGLSDVSVTRLPTHGPTANGPADMQPITLQAWPQRDGLAPLVAWLVQPGLVDAVNWAALGLPTPDKLFTLEGWHQRPLLDPRTQTFVDLAVATPAPRPLLRTAVRLWQTVAALAPDSAAPWDNRRIQNLALQVGLKQLALAELAQGAERQFMHKRAGWSGALRSRGQLADLARLLRALARSALPATDPSAQVRLAGELLELATTVAAVLDDAGLFPEWAIDKPPALSVRQGYAGWARAVQGFDSRTLADWLTASGAPAGFAANSSVLAALTAGLFTTPDNIGAGTFIHGMTRLLLTYGDAPYKRLRGGTGEAVIGPIYQWLVDNHVEIKLGTEVRAVHRDASGTVLKASLHKIAEADLLDFAVQLDGQVCGWPAVPTAKPLVPPLGETLEADAFVLAIPPFAGPITGLPDALVDSLQQINSVATIGLQHWTTQAPKYPAAIVAGLAGPLRCAAAMDHLQGGEGPNYTHAPVYWCGEVSNAVAKRWQADSTERDNWLRRNAGQFLSGDPAHPPHLSVNRCGSERYVLSDVQSQAARRHVYHADAPNLWLAGDWTRSAFACGSIEAAVTSGLEAAQHLLTTLGCRVDFPIVGALSGQDAT